MNYFNFEDYKKRSSKKNSKLNKRKLVIAIVIILIATLLIVLSSLYISKVEFRNFIDIHVLRKNISEENVNKIDIVSDDNMNFFAYDKYICILNKNILKTYSNSGKLEFESDISISTPLYDKNNRFLALAEKDGGKIYLLSGQTTLWQKDIDGRTNIKN